MGRNLWFTEADRSPFSGLDSGNTHPVLRLQLRNITEAHLRQACERISGWNLSVGQIRTAKTNGLVMQVRVRASSCSNEQIDEIMHELKQVLSLMINGRDTVAEAVARRNASLAELSHGRNERLPYRNDPRRIR